jgi:hypothetical protein
MPVAHTCNPTYLGGWDQEDWCSMAAQANSLRDSISKITRPKQTGGVAQVAPNPKPTKKERKKSSQQMT